MRAHPARGAGMALALALCASLAAAAAAAAGDEPFAGPAVNRAKVYVIQAQRDNEHIGDVLQQRCKAELDATAEWSSGVAALSNSATAESKRGVQQALHSRVGGLEAALRKMLAVRARLGEHIARVNRAFSWMHDASMRDVNHATDLLRALGAVLGTHDRLRGPALDPIAFEPHPLHSTRFGPAANASAAAAPNATATAAAAAQDLQLAFAQLSAPQRFVLPAFLDLSSSVARTAMRRAAARARGDGGDLSEITARAVTEAYRRAVHMYNAALSSWRRLKADFERERQALSNFRNRIDALIAAKHSTVVQLSEQLQETSAALAAPEPAMATAVDEMEEHARVLHTSCDGMKQAQQYFTEQRAIVLSDISSSFVPPPPASVWAPAKSANATQPAAESESEPEPEPEQPAATGGEELSAAATGATGAPQPPAATAGAPLEAQEAANEAAEAVAANAAGGAL